MELRLSNVSDEDMWSLPMDKKKIKLFLYFRMNVLRVWKFFLHIVRVQEICVDLN